MNGTTMDETILVDGTTTRINGDATLPAKKFTQRTPHVTSANGESKEPRKRFSPKVIGVLTVVLLAIGFAGYLWWEHMQGYVNTDNAYVTGHIHQISSRISGTISEVLVDDNQSVTNGQVLLKLDPRDNEVHLEQARTQVQQAEAQIAQNQAAADQAEAQLNQASAQISQAEAQLEKTSLDYQRAKNLFRDGMKAISQQELDAAKAAYDVAQGALKAAKANEVGSKAQVQSAKAAQSVALAKRQNAEAALKDAELQLSYTTIPVPTSGRIGHKTVEVGQRVQPGQALLAVADDQTWVVANFKETQLAKMKPGQKVEVELDALPHHRFSGRVESFAPASGAQFALLPPDNATGNFTKIVQRVPVKVVFDPESIRGFESRIVPGLSAEVDVAVR
nr:HlyD family secretion protein [Pedosphaera parvula]